MKKLIFALCAIIFTGSSFYAQENSLINDDRFEFNAGIETNHVWRGLVVSDKPTVTGMLKLNLDQQKQWSIGFWGGTAISNENDGTHYKEINYFVQYASKHFTVGLWDLYNSRGNNKPEIFNYNEDETKHIIDLRTSYFISNEFPLSLQANILLFGSADRQYGLTNKDDDIQRYSTYIEAAYPVYNGQVDVSAFLGCGIALDGDTHLYGNQENSFDVVNVGLNATKKVTVGNFSFPVTGMVFWNPSNELVRMHISTTLF